MSKHKSMTEWDIHCSLSCHPNYNTHCEIRKVFILSFKVGKISPWSHPPGEKFNFSNNVLCTGWAWGSGSVLLHIAVLHNADTLSFTPRARLSARVLDTGGVPGRSCSMTPSCKIYSQCAITMCFHSQPQSSRTLCCPGGTSHSDHVPQQQLEMLRHFQFLETMQVPAFYSGEGYSGSSSCLHTWLSFTCWEQHVVLAMGTQGHFHRLEPMETSNGETISATGKFKLRKWNE